MTVEKKPKSAAPREPRFRSILFICAANTARSVMAEHILRREADVLGFDHNIVITSAGIAPDARDGALVSLDTRMALREVGIDIGDEATSTDLKRHPEMLVETDLIIAMTEQQARELVERFPGVKTAGVYAALIRGRDGRDRRPLRKGRPCICRMPRRNPSPGPDDHRTPVSSAFRESWGLWNSTIRLTPKFARFCRSRPRAVSCTLQHPVFTFAFSIWRLLKAHALKAIPVNSTVHPDATLRNRLRRRDATPTWRFDPRTRRREAVAISPLGS